MLAHCQVIIPQAKTLLAPFHHVSIMNINGHNEHKGQLRTAITLEVLRDCGSIKYGGVGCGEECSSSSTRFLLRTPQGLVAS